MSLSPLAECLQGQAIAERDFIAGKIFLRYSSEVSERPQSRGCHIEQPGQSKQVTFSHSSHRFAADICCGHEEKFIRFSSLFPQTALNLVISLCYNDPLL
jgi:hypothetical protein